MENQFKKIMSDEIKKRLDSKNWNYRIAASVLEKKNQTKKYIIYATSFSSLAVAALILIFFIFGINQRAEPNLYNQFISNQLSGTYNEVFRKDNKTTSQYEQFINNQLKGTHNEVFDKEYRLTSSDVRGEDMILLNGTDTLIDNTLTIR
jgi:hypothetical protein